MTSMLCSIVRASSCRPPVCCVSGATPAKEAAAALDKEASGLSTGALEMAAYVLCAAALRRHLRFSALTTFTDSESARGATNAGSSPAPAMRPLLEALFKQGEQHLAVRVTTTQNRWADMASRGAADAVGEEARACGWEVVRERPSSREWDPLRAALRVWGD